MLKFEHGQTDSSGRPVKNILTACIAHTSDSQYIQISGSTGQALALKPTGISSGNDAHVTVHVRPHSSLLRSFSRKMLVTLGIQSGPIIMSP